jgi:transposase
MIALAPQVRILVATEPADFRKGIDSLAALCRAHLREDPFSGDVFVFRNRRATAIKLLTFDGHGFWLCLRRFSRGRVRAWPTSDAPLSELAAAELSVLLFQGDPRRADFAPAWRPLRPPAQATAAPARGEARAAHAHGSHAAGVDRTASADAPSAVR